MIAAFFMGTLRHFFNQNRTKICRGFFDSLQASWILAYRGGQLMCVKNKHYKWQF